MHSSWEARSVKGSKIPKLFEKMGHHQKNAGMASHYIITSQGMGKMEDQRVLHIEFVKTTLQPFEAMTIDSSRTHLNTLKDSTLLYTSVNTTKMKTLLIGTHFQVPEAYTCTYHPLK